MNNKSTKANDIGEILREEYMKPAGLSGYKLAKEMSVPVSRVQEILNGRRRITADTSVRLGHIFGKPDEFFINLQSSISVRKISTDNIINNKSNLTTSNLDLLEKEAIYIMREVVAECEKPVMLYSIGKDSSVMLHLALKAFYPEKPPFPFLHINTTWKFKEMIDFRDRRAKELGIEMLEYINEEGLKKNINPFDHGAIYTDIMKTQALKQALDKYGFNAAFGGGRRDEEKSRAKERIFSFRNELHTWEPKNQRPELWKCYNTEMKKGESLRVFPLSNWTESDIWLYIKREKIPIVPLYFAAERPVVERDGNLIMVDDNRMRLLPGEKPEMLMVRFRTLGCYPLSGGIRSTATTIDEVIEETLSATESERTSRVIDKDNGFASMEKRKREGYF